jgi:leader peptidase (prepilin peptidase) / N-methyltransferase
LVFFLAPLAGLVIGILNFLIRGKHDIPYGPFLCTATLVVLLGWAPIWHSERVQVIFILGWWLPTILAGAMALMTVLLFFYQKAKEAILGVEE